MFLKSLERFFLGLVVEYAKAHKAEIVSAVQGAVAADAPVTAYVNAAADRIVPAIARPIVDEILKQEEAQAGALASADAPTAVEYVISLLEKAQARLAA